MDRRGIPITMYLHSGNTNEQVTAVPLEKDVVKMLGNAKFIYCADAGLGSYNIRKFNSMGGRAFIVTQSIKKLSATLKKAVFNDFAPSAKASLEAVIASLLHPVTAAVIIVIANNFRFLIFLYIIFHLAFILHL